jgi:hypothetical protein
MYIAQEDQHLIWSRIGKLVLTDDQFNSLNESDKKAYCLYTKVSELTPWQESIIDVPSLTINKASVRILLQNEQKLTEAGFNKKGNRGMIDALRAGAKYKSNAYREYVDTMTNAMLRSSQPAENVPLVQRPAEEDEMANIFDLEDNLAEEDADYDGPPPEVTEYRGEEVVTTVTTGGLGLPFPEEVNVVPTPLTTRELIERDRARWISGSVDVFATPEKEPESRNTAINNATTGERMYYVPRFNTVSYSENGSVIVKKNGSSDNP